MDKLTWGSIGKTGMRHYFDLRMNRGLPTSQIPRLAVTATDSLTPGQWPPIIEP